MIRRIILFTFWASLAEVALVGALGAVFWDRFKPLLAAFLGVGQ